MQKVRTDEDHNLCHVVQEGKRGKNKNFNQFTEHKGELFNRKDIYKDTKRAI